MNVLVLASSTYNNEYLPVPELVGSYHAIRYDFTSGISRLYWYQVGVLGARLTAQDGEATGSAEVPVGCGGAVANTTSYIMRPCHRRER